ncbi:MULTISPECIES: glycosyltransferase [unclassified Pseudomonas]|uniref:glycosyltransferase n=1 Tax=unclassified Pseudomonas TaxID=196821 RepID=UPI0035C09EBF
MTLVSVMMPAYNAENYIAAALDSILEQSYPNIQIVVADDASTDRTPAIIREYAERFPGKIKAIFNLHNVGVTRNCNIALSHTDGDFIALFAGDDLMLPGKLARQVELMEANPRCVLCYHPVEIFDSATGKTLYVTNQHPREDVFNTQDMLLKGGIPGGCSIMLRRTALPPHGYDERVKTVSDWLFFLEISLKGTLLKAEEVLARYRKHLGGASRQTYELLDESLYALDLFEQQVADRKDLLALIGPAKARYVAGEAYRQLERDPHLALTLTRTVLRYQRSGKYRVLHAVAWLNRYVPGAQWVMGAIANRIKYVLKRVVG